MSAYITTSEARLETLYGVARFASVNCQSKHHVQTLRLTGDKACKTRVDADKESLHPANSPLMPFQEMGKMKRRRNARLRRNGAGNPVAGCGVETVRNVKAPMGTARPSNHKSPQNMDKKRMESSQELSLYRSKFCSRKLHGSYCSRKDQTPSS